MPYRSLIFLPFAAMVANAAGPAPEKIPAFREGLDALSARLWEVAEARFETALDTPEIDDRTRQTILLRVAESQIRAGESDSAMATLDTPILAENPNLGFWKAQALISAGQLGAALPFLDEKTTEQGATHYREARFTRASILQALGNSQEALDALEPLNKDKDPATAYRARLESATILLDLEKPEKALTSIPPPNAKMSPRNTIRAELLRANAQLARGEHQAAEGIFTALLQNDDPTALTFRNDAAVGLAKAQLAGGNREAAIDGLIAFVVQQRDTQRLGQALPLLLDCLPEEPAPDDIILTRLRDWFPRSLITPPIGIAMGEDCSSVWPTSPPVQDELATQAMYYLALGLRREGSPESQTEARRLLSQLRIDYPTHPLVERALLELSRWDLEDGRKEEAATSLAALDDQTTSPLLRAEASISAAATAFAAEDFKLAASELAKAAGLLEGDARREVTLSEAAARLADGDLPGFNAVTEAESGNLQMMDDLALERALFLASKEDPGALNALDRFILDHPDHKRLPEARLAAALTAVEATPPDPFFAKAQLDTLSEEQLKELPQGSLTLAQIRLAAQEDRWADAIQYAKSYLTENPDSPRSPEIRFELGWIHFNNGDYNDARLTLEKLATELPNSSLAAPALLLAARSAALGATPQAKQESIIIFDKLIALDGPLADVARLEKARVLSAPEAAKFLLPWFKSMKQDAPLRLIVGLHLCDSLYNSAGSDNKPLEQALEIYEDLLESLPEDSARRFEIEYNRGRVLEQLPDPKDPSKTREAEALDVYFSVLQHAARQPPADWQWVDRSGVRARTLLENAKRWDAAIAIAEQHAKLASPAATVVADRAKALRLEHFVWEE